MVGGHILDSQLTAYGHRVKDKVLVITGAANGIGREAALLFAQHGAKVVIGDLDLVGAGKVAAEIAQLGAGQATFIKCDVTNWDDQVALFKHAVDTYGSVDVVVANAGVTEIGQFQSVVLKDGVPQKPNFKTLDVNLTGVLYTVHLALHHLDASPVSDTTVVPPLKAIIMIGSMASWSAIPSGTMYSAAKHAVLGTMRSLHLSFKITNKPIRVGSIHPFFADTAIVPVVAKLFLAGIPKTPVERIAGAIFYAATDEDMETSGSGWLLADDGPVFRVDKEEFKLGVYKMIDERSNSLLRSARGLQYYANFSRDIWRIFGKGFLTIGVAAAAVGVYFKKL